LLLTLLVSVSRSMQNVSVSPFLNLMPSKTFPKVSIESMSPFCVAIRAQVGRAPGSTSADECAQMCMLCFWMRACDMIPCL